MKYKMIVLDLDGTLTNDKKKITPKTKTALMRAQSLGIRVVLASGRPTYGITKLADELEIEKHGGFILAFNGGKITDCESGKVVFEQKLDEADDAAEQSTVRYSVSEVFGRVRNRQKNKLS